MPYELSAWVKVKLVSPSIKVWFCSIVPSSLSKLISNELCASVMFVILAVSVSSLNEKETVYVGVGLV